MHKKPNIFQVRKKRIHILILIIKQMNSTDEDAEERIQVERNHQSKIILVKH